MLDLSHLNPEQKQAVTHGTGPLLIVAGPGTGKTTVISQRLSFLVEKKLAKPEEILAVTFSDKASQEMISRVDSLLSQSYSDLWVSTFHSFCDRVLREEGLNIGLPTDFKVADPTSAWLLVRQNLEEFDLNYYRPLGTPTKFLHALISHFSRCKDQVIWPEDYLKFSRKVKDREERKRLEEVSRAFAAYQKLLLKNNWLDFGDLINYCLRLFQARPRILEKYQRTFKYILVDEFQDTNLAQYQLVRLLASPKNNLTVSADDNQAIYRFRGASWGNIVNFKMDFPKARVVVLTKNYRSHQNILDLAYRFIQLGDHQRPAWLRRVSKNLKAFQKGKALISCWQFPTADQETLAVGQKILELLQKDKKSGFSDFAILVRANSQALVFARGLERLNIPFQFLALRGLYSKPVILDLVAYLNFLDNYHESRAAARVLNLACLKIDAQDVVRISQQSFRKSQSIFETLRQVDSLPNLEPKTLAGVKSLLALMEKHTRLAKEKNASAVLLSFLEDSGYLKNLIRQEKGEEIELIRQFFERVRSFEENHLDARLNSFLQEFNLELESGEEGKLDFDPDQGPEVVRIMTVHAAKGLEFKYVFLVGLVEKRFPSVERKEPIELPLGLARDVPNHGDPHVQEEQRLFYVALTRAKEGLFLTLAQDYGGILARKPSRFLLSLGLSPVLEKSQRILSPARFHSEKIKKELLPERFSFTQLAAFQKCPLQYKFAHVLKIPVKGRPVFSFGKTMHNTLFEFVRQSLKKPLSFAQLEKIYRKLWLAEWYESPRQEKNYFQQGLQSLKRFAREFNQKPPRVLSLDGLPVLEQDFSLKVGGHTLVGKIDRVDEVPGGVEIIDYKTGSHKEKLRPEDRQQLLIYQIAAIEALGLRPQKLTYHYLDQGQKVSFLAKESDLVSEKKNIIRDVEKIRQSSFNPTPGWQCALCDFKEVCDYAKMN